MRMCVINGCKSGRIACPDPSKCPAISLKELWMIMSIRVLVLAVVVLAVGLAILSGRGS